MRHWLARNGRGKSTLAASVAAGALAACAAAYGWSCGQPLFAVMPVPVLALLLCRTALAQRRLERAIGMLAVDHGRSTEEAIAVIAARLHAHENRPQPVHPISGLPTRDPLFETIESDIANGAGGACLGILRVANYDRIASLNQARADQMLAALAERLSSAAHRDRMLSQVDRNCLAIWMRGTTDAQLSLAEFQALVTVADQDFEADGVHLHPQLEIGYALHPADGNTPAQLLVRAMTPYSRIHGRSELGHAIRTAGPDPEDVALEHDVAHAIDAGQLWLAYQPVVDLSAGRLAGAEALLRWDHPEHGAIPPSRFIPIVEMMGLSDVYGLWVLNAAAKQAKSWQNEGLGHLSMAVNLSAHQLLDDGLGSKIIRTIERHRLGPEQIELELTESAAMADARHTERVFADLRERGIRLAIDDFGTGYSSLSHLKRLPFNKLKIDRSFVTGIQHRRDSRAICRALVELSAGLDLTVLAEGVECEDEVSTLLDLGCSLFQGYYFARPMSGDDFTALARDASWLARLAAQSRPPLSKDRLEHRLCT